MDDLTRERYPHSPEPERYSRSAAWNRHRQMAQAMALAAGTTWQALTPALQTVLHTAAQDLDAYARRYDRG